MRDPHTGMWVKACRAAVAQAWGISMLQGIGVLDVFPALQPPIIWKVFFVGLPDGLNFLLRGFESSIQTLTFWWYPSSQQKREPPADQLINISTLGCQDTPDRLWNVEKQIPKPSSATWQTHVARKGAAHSFSVGQFVGQFSAIKPGSGPLLAFLLRRFFQL